MQGRNDHTRIVSVQEGDAEALVASDFLEGVEAQDSVLVKALEAECPKFFEGIEKFLNFLIEFPCPSELFRKDCLERFRVFSGKKEREFLFQVALFEEEEERQKKSLS